MQKNITRRGFIGLAAASGAAAVLTGCASGSGSAGSASAAASGSASKAKLAEVEESVMPIDYKNYYFDFTDQIAQERAAVKMVPDPADIEITASDANGASGVVLVPEFGAEGSGKYYFNALVVGSKVTFTAKDGAKIKEAKSTAADSDIAVASDGKTATFTPQPIKIQPQGLLAGETITVVMESGAEYTIPTASEALPVMEVTGKGVADGDAGRYTFSVNCELVSVNSKREVVYYRDVRCIANSLVNNFQPETVNGEQYYSFYINLNQKIASGGMGAGAWCIMDENYKDIDFVDMLKNDDPNHTHGEGYVDFHEIRVLGPKHYLTLSYTPITVDNLPASVKGVDGTSQASVFAGIFQEVEDGKVVAEINTTDYQGLYESAVEAIKFDELVGVLGEQKTWNDYVHPNSLDYILNDAGNVQKLLVSMRDQSAVFQFDMPSGKMEWILGGKASTLSGFDDYSETRKDDKGIEFNAIMFGQHYARYHEVKKDGTLDVSVFDNWTGSAPYFYENKELPTKSRVLKLDIDPAKGTAKVNNCVNGRDLDLLTGKDHMADHCGSVDYLTDTSTMIGWGLHMPVDMGMPAAKQYGLAQGEHCIFTDWDDKNKAVNMELNLTASPLTLKRVDAQGDMNNCGSYRSYKVMG